MIPTVPPVSSSSPRRTRVLVISHDVVSPHMAGPGIRSLELARVLREHVDVVLATPNDSELAEPGIRLHPYRYGEWERLRPAFEGVDVLVCNALSLYEYLLAGIGNLGLPIVVDLYDPFPLENLHMVEEGDEAKGPLVHLRDMAIIDTACQMGDFFLCANERQRDWWLGVLLAKGRINPPTVTADPSLRSLLEEVPFGLPAHPFQRTGRGPRDDARFSADDRLILWGGGLWNWLDPLTLIRAMPAVLAEEPRARLLFPGTRHPNHYVAAMKRTEEAFSLAETMGLRDSAVFFGDWVAYEDWPAYLGDADVAVSLHHDTVETRFAAVRSRVLSYIWAGLPMVVSGGDAASELVATHGLGEVVNYLSEAEVSAALLRVLARGKAPYATRFEPLTQAMAWPTVAQPLVDFCLAPRHAADHAPEWLALKRDAAQYEQQSERLKRLEEEAALHRHHIELQATHATYQAEHIAHQAQRIQLLEAQLRQYEQGRFMRLMRGWQRVRATLGRGPS